MATRYLYLIRHAQYDLEETANPAGNLSRTGKRQARLTAKVLGDLPITAIHTSTIPRALQTAQPLMDACPEVKAQHSRLLWECIPPLFPDDREQYFGHAWDEDLQTEHIHAEKAFTHYFRPTRGGDKHEVLFTHGNLIRYLVCRALGADGRAWLNMISFNCGITRVAIDSSGNCLLIAYNDTGHLPPELRTNNLY